MHAFILFFGLVGGTAALAADDPYFTVTCTAHMVERESGYVEEVYVRTRGGTTYEAARELAEDNVMEICSMDGFRLNLQDSHTCRLIDCSRQAQ